MSRRTLRLIEERAEIEVRFPFDEVIKAAVKQLPRARWDPAERAWYVPVDYAGELLEELEGCGFEVGEAVRRAAARGGRNAMIRRLRRAARRDGLTVAQVNAHAHHALQQAFPGDTWIVGRISSWRRQRNGHAYFELVEQYEGERQPRARLSAVAFSKMVWRMERTLAALRPPLELRDGLQIKVAARVELYRPTGKFSVQIQDLDPQYTVTQLSRRREAILQTLDELGISEQNLELPLPAVPLRVALITSDGSDACKDFLHELEISGYGFEVSLLDVRVQGEQLEPTVLRALRWCAARAEHLDVVAIVRGGGSRLDLEGFDSYSLGEAVCRLPVPVLIGIGHQADVSVLDDLARSLKTPTAAARELVSRVRDFSGELAELSGRLGEHASRQSQRHAAALEGLVRELAREARHRLERTEAAVLRLAGELELRARAQLEVRGAALAGLSERTRAGARRQLRAEARQVRGLEERLGPRRFLRELGRERSELDRLLARLERSGERRLERAGRALAEVGVRRLERAAGELIDQRERDLELAAVRVEARDPARVLARGYAWVTDALGEVVRDAERVAPGARLSVRVARGRLAVRRIEGE